MKLYYSDSYKKTESSSANEVGLTAIRIGEIDKLNISSTFNPEYAIPSISFLLGQRRAIAEILRKKYDESEVEFIKQEIDRINDLLRDILAL